jgi:hypothetical protein
MNVLDQVVCFPWYVKASYHTVEDDGKSQSADGMQDLEKCRDGLEQAKGN